MKSRFRYLRKASKNPLPKLRRKLTLVFNAYIRARDKDRGCISCGGPVQQAGHYWSTSQCPQPSMRFNTINVNGQCTRCNTFLEGARQGYAKGLIRRYGAGILALLDTQRSLRQNPWTHFEYETMIKYYQDKLKQYDHCETGTLKTWLK